MAYSPYTPNPTAITTISVPDDAEMLSSGIGAINTPLEDLADAVAHQCRLVYTWLYDDEFEPWDAYPWNAFTDATFQAASSGGIVDVPNCAAGDTLIVHVACDVKNDTTPTPYAYSSLRCVFVEDFTGMATAEYYPYGGQLVLGCAGTRTTSIGFAATHTVTASGTTRARLEGVMAPGAGAFRVGAVGMIVEHVRGG